MKQRGIPAVLCLAFLLALVGSVSASPLPPDRPGPIVVGGDQNFPPYEFLDANAEPTGYNVDLVSAVAEVMGLEVEIQLGSWPEVRAGLEGGEIDMLGGMFYSQERDRLVDFSNPHAFVHRAIFVRRGESQISSPDDLPGRAIIVQEGDIMHDYALAQGWGEGLVLVQSPAEGLRLLASGAHDCALLGEMQGLYLADRFRLTNLTVAGPSFYPTEYAFAVREGDAELLAALNEGLNILRETGRFQEIGDKWFGPLKSDQALLATIARYVAMVVVPLIVLLGGTLLWSWSLRRQVAQRTVELESEIEVRLQTEVALLESEQRFRRIVEISPFPIAIMGSGGHLEYVNPQFSQVFGYALAEIPTVESCFALVYPDPDYRQMVWSAWKKDLASLAEGAVEPRIFTAHARDGTEKILVYHLLALHKDRTILFYHDISERERAAAERERLLQKLQEQAYRIQQMVDAVPEGVILLGEESRIVLANPVALSYLAALRGPDDGELLSALGDRPLAELLQPPPAGLWHEIAPKNSQRIFELVARPLAFGPTQQGWVLVIRDVTQARQIESQVQQQQRLAAVGQLAAGIAHDFNNMLAVTMLQAQLALQDADLAAGTRQRLATINQEARRAADLIEQILDFGRRSVLRQRPVDLEILLREQVDLFQRTVPENVVIALQVEPDETGYWVHADPARIRQAITNLVVNARDAMPSGGELNIAMARETMSQEQQVSLPEPLPRNVPRPAGWIRLVVADSGHGISPEVLPHVFEPFFTTKPPGAGSGLGLAQVYGIVTQHGGVIDVTSQPGEGTAFTIFVPALPAADERQNAAPDADAILPRGQGQTVLVAEDAEQVRRALAASLNELNYHPITAANGQEALALLREPDASIDLVLSDIVMPKMGGRELVQAMHEGGLLIPVVLISGYHPQGLEELLDQGVVEWIQKPVTLAMLAHALAKALPMAA